MAGDQLKTRTKPVDGAHKSVSCTPNTLLMIFEVNWYRGGLVHALRYPKSPVEHRVENIGHIRCIDSKKTKIINRDHQQDQKSTVQNSAGTQLSVPSCFPFSDIASLGKVVTEGLAPLLYQMVICLYPLSEFRKMHWTHSFRKAKDRKFEKLKDLFVPACY